jgi:hypothetical protein
MPKHYNTNYQTTISFVPVGSRVNNLRGEYLKLRTVLTNLEFQIPTAKFVRSNFLRGVEIILRVVR